MTPPYTGLIRKLFARWRYYYCKWFTSVSATLASWYNFHSDRVSERLFYWLLIGHLVYWKIKWRQFGGWSGELSGRLMTILAHHRDTLLITLNRNHLWSPTWTIAAMIPHVSGVPGPLSVPSQLPPPPNNSTCSIIHRRTKVLYSACIYHSRNYY